MCQILSLHKRNNLEQRDFIKDLLKTSKNGILKKALRDRTLQTTLFLVVMGWGDFLGGILFCSGR